MRTFSTSTSNFLLYNIRYQILVDAYILKQCPNNGISKGSVTDSVYSRIIFLYDAISIGRSWMRFGDWSIRWILLVTEKMKAVKGLNKAEGLRGSEHDRFDNKSVTFNITLLVFRFYFLYFFKYSANWRCFSLQWLCQLLKCK